MLVVNSIALILI